ncbi:3-oxoacyl-ACP reductase [Planctomycetales bacterium]|nr:3-oxoacyl-ACP reductase [Planctomycetales bacterium]
MSEFANKTALITGATGSIGKEIARRIVQEGGNAFITDLDQKKIDEAVKDIGKNCAGLAADVTQLDAVAAVVKKSQDTFGENIHVLVNVAGTSGKGNKIEDITEADWDFIYAVNVKGSFFFIKHVLPIMKKQGSGAIVNFSSKSGKTGSALMSAYSSAKGAIITLTQAVAYETAKLGIRCNCVCPGVTDATGVWTHVSADYVNTMHMPMEDIVKTFTAKVPMGRLGKIEDVVNAACFLASDRAAYMTGQAINVTGGREMH